MDPFVPVPRRMDLDSQAKDDGDRSSRSRSHKDDHSGSAKSSTEDHDLDDVLGQWKRPPPSPTSSNDSRAKRTKMPRTGNQRADNETGQALSRASGSNSAPVPSTEDPTGDLDSETPELMDEDGDNGESMWTQAPFQAASVAYQESQLGAIELLDELSASSPPDPIHFLIGVTELGNNF